MSAADSYDWGQPTLRSVQSDGSDNSTGLLG